MNNRLLKKIIDFAKKNEMNIQNIEVFIDPKENIDWNDKNYFRYEYNSMFSDYYKVFYFFVAKEEFVFLSDGKRVCQEIRSDYDYLVKIIISDYKKDDYFGHDEEEYVIVNIFPLKD